MKKFIRSFAYAFRGISTAFKGELNLRFHCASAILVIASGFYFKVTRIEFCVLLICCGLVISAEIFNTAIETLTNLVSPAESEMARKTKDMAAAGVLIAVIASMVVGMVIFIPKIF